EQALAVRVAGIGNPARFVAGDASPCRCADYTDLFCDGGESVPSGRRAGTGDVAQDGLRRGVGCGTAVFHVVSATHVFGGLSGWNAGADAAGSAIAHRLGAGQDRSALDAVRPPLGADCAGAGIAVRYVAAGVVDAGGRAVAGNAHTEHDRGYRCGAHAGTARRRCAGVVAGVAAVHSGADLRRGRSGCGKQRDECCFQLVVAGGVHVVRSGVYTVRGGAGVTYFYGV
ncbi:ABC transporter involved in cytochrome c biogenesis, CcmB subunit, partial [Sideroxydans sp. CL21]